MQRLGNLIFGPGTFGNPGDGDDSDDDDTYRRNQPGTSGGLGGGSAGEPPNATSTPKAGSSGSDKKKSKKSSSSDGGSIWRDNLFVPYEDSSGMWGERDYSETAGLLDDPSNYEDAGGTEVYGYFLPPASAPGASGSSSSSSQKKDKKVSVSFSQVSTFF